MGGGIGCWWFGFFGFFFFLTDCFLIEMESVSRPGRETAGNEV